MSLAWRKEFGWFWAGNASELDKWNQRDIDLGKIILNLS